jgi:hypothetical protein
MLGMWDDTAVTGRKGKKRAAKPFSAVKAVKSLARERIGAPPPEKVESGKRKPKAEKHKPKLEDLLQGE